MKKQEREVLRTDPPRSGTDRSSHAFAAPRRHRPTANLLGAPFGLSGLAQAWTTGHDLVAAPAWPGEALWICAAVLWAVTTAGYGAHVLSRGRVRADFTDPTLGPFTALIAIVPMLLGVTLAPHARTAGETVFLIALVSTILIGAGLTAQWIRSPVALARWHPGYFLPTVAGGLIAAGGSAALGFGTLSRMMLGYGTVNWLALGPILLLRLFTVPALPAPLVPTLAIELAPPVVAGNAWYALNGGRTDTAAALLGGYAVLMALVQVGLLPVFRRAPFGPGTWAFAFSYAAALTDALHWLAAEQADGQRPLSYALLGVGTLAMGFLALHSVLGLSKGTYLPRSS